MGASGIDMLAAAMPLCQIQIQTFGMPNSIELKRGIRKLSLTEINGLGIHRDLGM